VARRVTEEVGAQHNRVIVVFREYPMTGCAQGGVTLDDEGKARHSRENEVSGQTHRPGWATDSVKEQSS
jgi:hypothetical protein